MLEKLLNKKVRITEKNFTNNALTTNSYKGVVTDVNENFIEIDSEKIISVKYISLIEVL